MPKSLAQPYRSAHLSRLETVSPTMAKADLKKVETDWRTGVGGAVVRMRQLAGLSQKEFAALVKRDVGQVARWESGAERVQADLIYAANLGPSWVLAQAELVSGIEVTTQITIRRTA